MRPLPLEGIRVLDVTVVWAGPFATQLLGDMGAEVIRVESLQHPDINTRGQPVVPREATRGSGGVQYPHRDPGDRPWNRNSVFNCTGRNKLSFTVDLLHPRGKEVFFRLVSLSDILVENNSAGVMESLGIPYGVLTRVNPYLIMMSLPAFGLNGPYRHYKAYAANMEAVLGHTLLRTYPGSGPTETTASYIADAAGGASSAFAVLAALHHRMRTGRGQFIEMSQAENVVHHLSQALMDYSMNGRAQESLGNRDRARAPQGVYRCAGDDRWIAISCGNDQEFAGLCEVMGRPDLQGDDRFTTGLARYRNHDALDAVIQAWSGDRDHYQVFHALQAAGVPAGPVITTAELFEDPHLRARGFWEPVTHPEAGAHLYPGPIVEMTGTPLHIRAPAPLLGQHNRYVYSHLLGYPEEQYREFQDLDFIGDTYLVARR